MRIFRVGSKNRKLRRQNSLLASPTNQHQQQQPPIEALPSIGSELAASDQFEILVSRRGNGDSKDLAEQQQHNRRKNRGGFLSYFGNDNDDSTVSSITTVEYVGFFHNATRRPQYIHHATTAAAESISSWCCCGDSDNTTKGGGGGTSGGAGGTGGSTRRTHPSSTDNTLIQHSAYGTLQPNDSRSQMYRSTNGSIGTPIMKRQRSFLFSNYYTWGRSGSNTRNNNNNNSSNNYNSNDHYLNADSGMKNIIPNMSASLFDDLSEDELDLHLKRSTSFSVGRRGGNKKNQQSPDQSASSKPISLRRVLTWKRSKVL